MPLGRMIGVCLALVVISVGAAAKTTDKAEKAGAARAKPHAVAHHDRARNAALHRRARLRRRYLARRAPEYVYDAALRTADAYLGPMHPEGEAEIGTAVWYGMEGGRTASGERLDGVTATAAHRTLPLNSYARVTNLDNGRSIIVKINDRGPWHRRFVIDLSRPAARELGISGTAAVAIDPMAPGAAPAAAGQPKIAASSPVP